MSIKMILFFVWGVFIGLFLPAVCGRFGKLIPADPGEIILRLFHRQRIPQNKKNKYYTLWKKKQTEFYLWSLFWGFLTGFLYLLVFLLIPKELQIMGCVFITIINATIIIDAKYWLLPDFFTLPLLILGFGFSLICPNFTTEMALIGVTAGYLVSVLSVLVLAFSPKKQLGCGDVKMITALGAWLGLMGLNLTLIFSFILFIVYDLLKLHKKGAYGPALGTSAIIVFFLMYMK